jgi:AAA15 family ATPase/GTPase
MLLEFQVTNFRSFRDEQTLSLVAGRDVRMSGNLTPTEPRCVKVAAIYGANGSGKSNLFRAYRFARRFVVESATRFTRGDEISGISPFRLDRDSLEKPSGFEFLIRTQDITYQYGFSATGSRVVAEWLFVVKGTGGKRSRWFEREYDSGTDEYSWRYGSNSPFSSDIRRLLQEVTRPNGLTLSRGAELNSEALWPLFRWFRTSIALDMSASPHGLAQRTATRIVADDAMRKRVVELMRDADLSISDLQIDEEPALTGRDVDALRDVLTAKSLELAVERSKNHRVRTRRVIPGTNESVEFELADESMGTQRFFAVTGPLVDALRVGSAVFIDELDCSMHPLLTRKLVELFQGAANRHGAQLIFNTHDTSLMRPDLLRRDQIWFVERGSDFSSSLFSLAELKKTRSTEQFEHNYMTGRYGAVPEFSYRFTLPPDDEPAEGEAHSKLQVE